MCHCAYICVFMAACIRRRACIGASICVDIDIVLKENVSMKQLCIASKHDALLPVEVVKDQYTITVHKVNF